jgi:hypothetical protein
MAIENNQTKKWNPKTYWVHTIRVLFCLVTEVLHEVQYSTFRPMEKSLLFSHQATNFHIQNYSRVVWFLCEVLHEVDTLLLEYIFYKSLTFTCACTREPGDFGMKVFKDKDSLNGLKNTWKDQNIHVFLDLSI